MSIEIPLKLKYRVRRAVSKGGRANYGGTSGRPVRATNLPVGIPKHPRGKTSYR